MSTSEVPSAAGIINPELDLAIQKELAESRPKSIQKEWDRMLRAEIIPATIRTELTGMLPGAIRRFEELLITTADLDPQVVKGYDSTAGKDNFAYWGVACRIQCTDMAVLKASAGKLGFLWLSDEGDLAYTDGLSIDDFQTFRVNGDLELTSEKEEV